MPCFFPVPYPDELLYSVLARYHVRSGNISSKATLDELFDSRTVVAVVDMPCYIDRLIERFRGFIRCSAEELVLRYTLYPYYTAFLSKERSLGVLQSMRRDYGGDIHTKTGIMASSIHTPTALMFCPVCFKEDIGRYGETYWHRLHQIPGVLVCPKHFCSSLASRVRIHAGNRHEFIAASEGNCITVTEPVSAANASDNYIFENLIQIAQDSQYLLEHSEAIRETVGAPEVSRKKYLDHLKGNGFATCEKVRDKTRRVYNGPAIGIGTKDELGDDNTVTTQDWVYSGKIPQIEFTLMKNVDICLTKGLEEFLKMREYMQRNYSHLSLNLGMVALPQYKSFSQYENGGIRPAALVRVEQAGCLP